MVWYDGYVTLWALCLFLHVVIKGEICGAALDQTDLRTKSSEVPCSKSKSNPSDKDFGQSALTVVAAFFGSTKYLNNKWKLDFERLIVIKMSFLSHVSHISENQRLINVGIDLASSFLPLTEQNVTDSSFIDNLKRDISLVG